MTTSAAWYALDTRGMALRRETKAEAQCAAAFYDRTHPQDGPHKAVQLTEVTPEVAHAAEAFAVLRKLSACLDPDDWAGDERMLDLIDPLLNKVAEEKADHELSSTEAGLTS